VPGAKRKAIEKKKRVVKVTIMHEGNHINQWREPNCPDQPVMSC
jgi:hypothetical protein